MRDSLTGSIVDQHLTEDMANYQVSHGSVSVAHYINMEARRSILHSHPYYEYILVRKGKAIYQANGQNFSLYPDEMLLISPGVPHVLSIEPEQASYERLILQINAAYMAEIFRACGEDTIRSVSRLTLLPAEATISWGIQELMQRIYAASKVEDEKIREMLYKSQITELVLTIELIAHHFTPKAPSDSNSLISNVTAYIQENYRDPSLKVADLARRFYVSREHLSRTFKEYTGDSLRDYVQNLRMQEFRNGLIRGDSVLLASRESGFPDYSSFVKSFRKLYGITPVEYREQLKKAMDQLSSGEEKR